MMMMLMMMMLLMLIVSKWLNISSNIFHNHIAALFQLFLYETASRNLIRFAYEFLLVFHINHGYNQ